MSLVVFAIAAVPAVVVALIAHATNSKLATGLAAAAGVGVGLLTGNPAYAILDIAFVALATWLSWPESDPEKDRAIKAKRAEEKAYQETEEYKRKEKVQTYLIWTAMAAGTALYYFWDIYGSMSSETTAPPAAAAPRTQTSTPRPAAAPPAGLANSKPTSATAPPKPKPQPKKKSPIENCVEIRDEQKMLACLGKLEHQ